jgi:hypothetical protein
VSDLLEFDVSETFDDFVDCNTSDEFTGTDALSDFDDSGT